MPAHISKQPSGEKAEVSVAEQGSSEHACCELCEQAGHNKEDCPLVVAAQESEASPEADWQVVAGKTSEAQAKGKKAGKGAKGNKVGKGSKDQGKEKRGGATMVITAHRDGSNG